MPDRHAKLNIPVEWSPYQSPVDLTALPFGDQLQVAHPNGPCRRTPMSRRPEPCRSNDDGGHRIGASGPSAIVATLPSPSTNTVVRSQRKHGPTHWPHRSLPLLEGSLLLDQPRQEGVERKSSCSPRQRRKTQTLDLEGHHHHRQAAILEGSRYEVCHISSAETVGAAFASPVSVTVLRTTAASSDDAGQHQIDERRRLHRRFPTRLAGSENLVSQVRILPGPPQTPGPVERGFGVPHRNLPRRSAVAPRDQPTIDRVHQAIDASHGRRPGTRWRRRASRRSHPPCGRRRRRPGSACGCSGARAP